MGQERFSQAPAARMKSSKFDRSHTVHTAFNAGQLIPIYVDEVLPGDVIEMSVGAVVRMATPMDPVMDGIGYDVYAFFVPCRLVWENWDQFMGENKAGFWDEPADIFMPKTMMPESGWQPDSIADYMGLPTLVTNQAPSTNGVASIYLRAYPLIWNEWFRSENLQQPVEIDTGDDISFGSAITDPTQYVTQSSLGGPLLPVNKRSGYFTRALPEPQKGPDVIIPALAAQMVPVLAGTVHSEPQQGWVGVQGAREGAGGTWGTPSADVNIGLDSDGGIKADSAPNSATTAAAVTFTNLWAQLPELGGASVNELRVAFQRQRFYEKDARGGTRYVEVLATHFGVTSPDSRLQNPEFLGGYRKSINIDQVLSTAAIDSLGGTDPVNGNLGSTGAYSLTGQSPKKLFKKGFVEHGILMILTCVRTLRTYQQGQDRMWDRETREDFYWPTFAHFPEQGVLNKEIYYQGNGLSDGSGVDNEVFGYQEAWSELRYKESRLTGAFRANYPGGGLITWTYADVYDELPVLSDQWIREPQENVDRTVIVQSTLGKQFIGQFGIYQTWQREMPVYSVPGMIDHF